MCPGMGRLGLERVGGDCGTLVVASSGMDMVEIIGFGRVGSSVSVVPSESLASFPPLGPGGWGWWVNVYLGGAYFSV